MNMTKNEILKSYNEAKDKNNQITVLADLNLTTRAEITDILFEMGVSPEELPKRAGRKKGVKMEKKSKIFKEELQKELPEPDETKPQEEKTEQQEPRELTEDERKDNELILSVITKAAVEEEGILETYRVKRDEINKTVQEHEHKLEVYSRYMKELREAK